jgi:hypothetical protein
MLHQGSVKVSQLSEEFAERFASALCPDWSSEPFPHELLSEATLLAKERYAPPK